MRSVTTPYPLTNEGIGFYSTSLVLPKTTQLTPFEHLDFVGGLRVQASYFMCPRCEPNPLASARFPPEKSFPQPLGPKAHAKRATRGKRSLAEMRPGRREALTDPPTPSAHLL